MKSLSHSSAAFFEAKYQCCEDPWDFQISEYELRRYDAIVNALDGAHFGSALEPGCSVGVLTKRLAPFCEKILAFDFSPTAACAAEKRCKNFPHVQVACLALQDVPSFSKFDLIVLSEVGYYFSESDWKVLSRRIVSEMSPGATLLAAHWTGRSKDHEISADTVHNTLLTSSDLVLKRDERHVRFLLGKWVRS